MHYIDTCDRHLKPLPSTKMATRRTSKKPSKKPSEPGPLEKALTLQDNADRAAKRAIERRNEPIIFSLPESTDSFYPRQSKHKYGTCWQCGDPRNHAGGLPGGSDAYWCDRCQHWLPVRDSLSDPVTVPIHVGKSRG